MTMEQALMAAIVTLTGAIGSMALWFKAQFNAVAEKLDECEEDRTELWETLALNGIRKMSKDPTRASRGPRIQREEEE